MRLMTKKKPDKAAFASQHRENPQSARQHLPSSTAATLTWYGMSWNLQGGGGDVSAAPSHIQ